MTTPSTPRDIMGSSIRTAADALSSYSRAQAFYGENFVDHATASEADDEDDEVWDEEEGYGDYDDADDEEAGQAQAGGPSRPDGIQSRDFTLEGAGMTWERPQLGLGVQRETIEEDSVFIPSTYTSVSGSAPGAGMRDLRMTSSSGGEDVSPITPRAAQAGPSSPDLLSPTTPRPGGQLAEPSQSPTSPQWTSADEPVPAVPRSTPTETSPLLIRKKGRAASAALPRQPGSSTTPTRRRASQPSIPRIRSQRLSSASYATISRRPSMRQRRSWGLLKTQQEAPIAEAPGGGTSTFGQSLFNCIAILLGIGVLSESMAFAYAGWIGGFVLLVGYGFLTCYTAKILVRIMALDARIKSYADIAKVAFGPKSIWLTIAMFCLELFTLSVILVLLFSDTLHELYPAISSDMWKIIGLAFVLPTCFLPLNLLAFTSILGILSIVLLVATVLIDGFSISTTPGSLLNPAPTSLLPDWPRLPIAFGLLMSSFSGHTIIPSLAKDMREPERFDSMISLAYLIATVLYGVIASAGYLMFGNAVSDEVSKDLVNTPGYPKWLNIVMAIGLVINPLSKYALCTRPLSTTIESLLGITDAPLSADPHSAPSGSSGEPSTSEPKPAPPKRWLSKHTLYILLSRVSLSLIIVLTAILIPSFSIVMSFLGAFSAFLLCVIGPVSAKCMVEGRWKWYDVAILVVGSLMALTGTVTGFVEGSPGV